jgi:hypothetical protein
MVKWCSVVCSPPVPTSHRDGLWRRTLIEGSLVVCMSRLTDDNMAEWLFRIRFAQRLLDPGLFKLTTSTKRNGTQMPKEHDVTVKILRRWSGLWTDANNMTRHEWLNAVIHKVVQQVDGGVRSEVMTGATPRKNTGSA